MTRASALTPMRSAAGSSTRQPRPYGATLALVAEDVADGSVDDEEAGIDGGQVFDVGSLQELLQHYGVAELIRATGLPRRTLYDLRNGKVRDLQPGTLAALARAWGRKACNSSDQYGPFEAAVKRCIAMVEATCYYSAIPITAPAIQPTSMTC